MVFWSGCACPGGGISRPRSLLTAFSQVSASEAISFGDIVSKATPPAQSSLLWHFSQRFCRSDHWGGPASAAAVAGAAGVGAGLAEESTTTAACPHSGPATATAAPAKVRTRFLNVLRTPKRRLAASPADGTFLCYYDLAFRTLKRQKRKHALFLRGASAGPTGEPPAKTTPFAWPIPGGGNAAVVRKKRRRRLFSNEFSTELEQPYDLAARIDVDRVGGRHLRQARHRHDVPADHYDELGPGCQAHFPDVHHVVRGSTAQLRIGGERVLRLRYAHRIVAVAAVLELLDLRAHLAIGGDIRGVVDLRRDRFHLVPQRQGLLVHEAEAARLLAQPHDLFRYFHRTGTALSVVTRVNHLHAVSGHALDQELRFRLGVLGA